MKREELKDTIYSILFRQIDDGSADELIEATQEIADELFPLPPAEGAEEIIESILESLGDPINIHNHAFEIRPYTVDHKTEWWIFHKEVASGEPLAQWLDKFATLHAQKADKMVSERLREELEDFALMFNGKDNTYKFITFEHIDEYLKTR